MGWKEILFNRRDAQQMQVLKSTQYWKAETMRFQAQPEVEVAIMMMMGNWFLSFQVEIYYWLKKKLH